MVSPFKITYAVFSTFYRRNGNTDATKLPLACPQDGIDSSAMSEDCLSMILYVPNTVHIGSNVPVFVWYDYPLFS